MLRYIHKVIPFILLSMAARGQDALFNQTADNDHFVNQACAVKEHYCAVPLWERKFGGEEFDSPSNSIVENNIAYVSGGFMAGFVYALDLMTGKVLWRFDTFDVEARVLIAGDMIIFGSRQSYLFALNKITGKVIWKFKTDKSKETWSVVDTPAVVYRDKVIFGCANGFIYALNLQNGKLVWKYKTTQFSLSSPIVVDDTVVIGMYYQTIALNADNGVIKWTFGAEARKPVLAGDKIIFSYPYVYALDAHSGKLIWQITNNGDYLIHILVDKNIVYVTNWDNNVHAFDLLTGTEMWHFSLDRGRRYINDLPVIVAIVNNIMYINQANTIIGMDLNCRVPIFQISIPGTELGALEIVNGILLTASHGFVKAYQLNNSATCQHGVVADVR